MLPLPVGTHFKVSSGAFGCCTHNSPGFEYAWDFDVPYGTPVLAVEEGLVIQVWEPRAGGGCDRKYNDTAHNIKILAQDGTVAQYVHTQSKVHTGDHVIKGQIIGVTANNGFHCAPQLHFNIFQDRKHIPENGQAKTIPVTFQGVPDGGIAHEGMEGFVPPLFHISLVKDVPRAREEKETLQRLMIQYNLSPYIFTYQVQIEPMVIPHSHPVLTLNTRGIENPDWVLTTFLHEQIHWFESDKEKEVEKAIHELRTVFPNAPSGAPQGGENIHSTYLHLIVCWLELQADKHYLGNERAYEIINSQNHYTWIYQQVVAHEGQIGEIIKKHGLRIESDQ